MSDGNHSQPLHRHESVLLVQAVEALVTSPEGLYIDGTFGRGGHSGLILEALNERGRLLAIDRDDTAVAFGRERFEQEHRIKIMHGAFAEMDSLLAQTFEPGENGQAPAGSVDGVLLDLGVSSPQLDNAERGFSFMREGPLDMRMDTSSGQSAADWLATAPEAEIAQVLKQYGEERFGKRIARAVVEQREIKPLQTTSELAALVEKASPVKEKHKHPATRTFQGIRIFINQELQQLETALEKALALLKPGGRLVVISFHSLEDRIVKRFIKRQSEGEPLPRGLPIRDDQIERHMKKIGKAMKASPAEVKQNPRARSAVMRVAEKLA